MNELPAWWKWEAADGAWDVPVGSVVAVHDDSGEWIATLEWCLSTRDPNGVWYFRLGAFGGSFESGEYASMDAARRACERAYLALRGALEVDRGET